MLSVEMGVLSNRFKSNFLDLLKCLNSINWFIVFFSLINISVCIYEDQIGKFDWRQSYVGRIKFAQFDTVSTARKIIVATEENVLAALHLKTGQVVWRHVFESSTAGDIQLLHVSEKVLTVSGANPYLVRGWDSATGVLLWEWSLTVNGDHETSSWWVHQGLLVHMLPSYGAYIDVTTYNAMTGQNRGATSRLPAVWTNEGCVLSAPYYTCVSGTSERILLSLDITSNAVQMISKPVVDLIGQSAQGKLRKLDSTVIPGFIVDDKVVIIKNGAYEVVKDVGGATASIVDSGSGPLVLEINGGNKGIALSSYSIASAKAIPEVTSSDDSVNIPFPVILAGMCTKSPREQFVCRLFVNGIDDSATLLQQAGRVVWTREESLANVEAAEFVDLPVSDLEAAIESEFDLKEGSVWSAFVRRITTQWQQLRSLIARRGEGTADESEMLVRDYFNLHKIIVLVTRAGKMIGMDNLSGELLWQRFEPGLDTSRVAVLARRSARHPPLDACLTVVGRDKATGNGILVSVNPITGALIGERVLRLDTRLRQVALLPTPDQEWLHALVLLDEEEDVQVLPASAARLVRDFYMFVAEPAPARAQGYALKYDGTKVNAIKTWTLELGEHRLVALAAGGDRAHSPGRALADRSVLYKYLNPNLVLMVAEGPRTPGKDGVSATVIDAVSGAVVAAQAHRRARATDMAFLSENFMAYVYINEKTRRTEIATIELYEGKDRLSPDGPFSSLASTVTPVAERQAFIVAPVAAAAVTRTERALTDKHALFALTTGAIVELPWALLEPRRPLALTQQQREEGLIPYAPELPLPSEAVVNYNRTVERVKKIHTATSGLESTCLVLATGLDIFYTRVAPSKTFDLLKDDFDYFLITVVLAALIAATIASRHFAERKMLRQAWK